MFPVSKIVCRMHSVYSPNSDSTIDAPAHEFVSMNVEHQVRIVVYTLKKEATIDNPDYERSTTYTVEMPLYCFESLDRLKDGIINRTKAGFLKSQFFRIAFAEDFLEHGFLLTTADVKIALARRALTKQWEIAVVRYTKVQSAQLKTKISNEEFNHLERLLINKRAYKRNVDIIDANNVVTKVMIPNKNSALQSLKTLTFFDNDVFLCTDSEDEMCTGKMLLSALKPENETHAAKKESVEDNSANQARKDTLAQLKQASVASHLFSDQALSKWADMVLTKAHPSTKAPPPHFPIPDAESKHGYRMVSFPAVLYPLCLAFNGHLMKSRENVYSDSDDNAPAEVGTDP